MIAVPVLAKAKKEVECHIRRISIDGFGRAVVPDSECG